MGIAPPSKLVSSLQKPPPLRPFHPSSKSRSSLSLSYYYSNTTTASNNSILQQLIVLQDWQRVLIRAKLYPHELQQRMILRFQVAAATTNDHGGTNNNNNNNNNNLLQVKILPLHLVCALDPPAAVVQLLLELYADAATVPLLPVTQQKLSLRAILVAGGPRHCNNNKNPTTTDDNDGLTHHRHHHHRFNKPPLSSSSSSLSSHHHRFVPRKRRKRRPWKSVKRRIQDWYKTKSASSLLPILSKSKTSSSSSSLLLFPLNVDEEIMTGMSSPSYFAGGGAGRVTAEDEICLLAATATDKPESISVYYSVCQEDDDPVNLTDDDNDGNDDEDDDGETSSSKGGGSSLSSRQSWNNNESSSNNNHKNGVILQLSPSGGVTPLPLENNNENEENGTAGSLMSDASTCLFRVRWDMQALREEVALRGGLLPLHVACLYRANTDVLQVLLDAFPIAALSDVLGMLPIHWAASGWSLPPLLPAPASSSALLLPTDNVSATKSGRGGAGSSNNGPMEVLTLLKQVIPETVRVQSGNHGMTPDQYVEECMEDGDYKDACLHMLLEGVVDDDSRSLSTTSCSLLFVDSMSETSSLCLDGATGTVIGIAALIAKQNWPDVLNLLEDDPECASKWLYGIDPDKTMVAPVIWKRLPIHLACSRGAPVGVLQVLVQSFPEGAATADPHSGCLPLHTVCQTLLSPHNGGGSASRLQATEYLLQTCPTATKAVDVQGRLPLHLAVLAMAPYPVVEMLVEHDPQSASIADGNGKTAFEYAFQTYGREHMVTELLSMVLEFGKHLARNNASS